MNSYMEHWNRQAKPFASLLHVRSLLRSRFFTGDFKKLLANTAPIESLPTAERSNSQDLWM